MFFVQSPVTINLLSFISGQLQADIRKLIYRYGPQEAATQVLKIMFLGHTLPPRKKKKDSILGKCLSPFI